MDILPSTASLGITDVELMPDSETQGASRVDQNATNGESAVSETEHERLKKEIQRLQSENQQLRGARATGVVTSSQPSHDQNKPRQSVYLRKRDPKTGRFYYSNRETKKTQWEVRDNR